MEVNYKIQPGVYLVIDPSLEENILLDKLQNIVQEKIVAVQIWDNFSGNQNVFEIIEKIIQVCHKKNIPVLINNDWELLFNTNLDGVHFDEIPKYYPQIKADLNKDFICGVTCCNDLATVNWAAESKLDYISFCSVFPSPTSNSCELVDFETIKKARTKTDLPIFLAGGITPENMPKLAEVDYDGVAVVSGLMCSNDPKQAVTKYLKYLKN